MHVIAYADARKNLKSILDRVVDDADTAIITRRKGEDVVIMSKVDYDGLLETLHLLGSQANREHLAESIGHYHAGQVKQRELLE